MVFLIVSSIIKDNWKHSSIIQRLYNEKNEFEKLIKYRKDLMNYIIYMMAIKIKLIYLHLKLNILLTVFK